jgi:hypothetical protein
MRFEKGESDRGVAMSGDAVRSSAVTRRHPDKLAEFAIKARRILGQLAEPSRMSRLICCAH